MSPLLLLPVALLDLAWWLLIWRRTRAWQPLRIGASAMFIWQMAWLLAMAEPELRVVPHAAAIDLANIAWHAVLMPVTLGVALVSAAWRGIRARLTRPAHSADAAPA